MPIEFRHKGDFKKTNNYFKKLKQAAEIRKANEYAQRGLDALMSATPKRTGLTADSWIYKITRGNGHYLTISYENTNIQNGENIAIILDVGHFHKKGHYWIAGRHYIEPAIQPVFEQIANDLWEEIIAL